MDDDWLSIQEAADALGIHYRKAWKMARSGELPSEARRLSARTAVPGATG